MKLASALAWTTAGLLCACVTRPPAGHGVSVRLDCKNKADEIEVTATLTNRTKHSLSIIEHPDWYSMSVQAADPKKQTLVHYPGFISWLRPTYEEAERVGPGESFSITNHFQYRYLKGGALRIGINDPGTFGPPVYIVRDDKLRATFEYHPDKAFLPRFWWLSGHRFLGTRLEAQMVFPRP